MRRAVHLGNLAAEVGRIVLPVLQLQTVLPRKLQLAGVGGHHAGGAIPSSGSHTRRACYILGGSSVGLGGASLALLGGGTVVLIVSAVALPWRLLGCLHRPRYTSVLALAPSPLEHSHKIELSRSNINRINPSITRPENEEP